MKNPKVKLAALIAILLAVGCRKNDFPKASEALASSDTATFSMKAISGGKKVTNIIKPGTGDFWFSGNFNQTYGLNPGDTVVLQAGTYGHIDITTIDGITFINSGQVVMSSVNFNNGAKNVRLLGNGTSGITYGIKLTSPSYFGIDWQATGDLEIGFIEVAGNTLGMKVATDATQTYPLNVQNLWIHDCYVHDTKYEALYIGADGLGGPFITGRIERNDIRNIANDGIQTRNGSFEILNNRLEAIGLARTNWQNHGILVGGDTKNSTIKGNNVVSVTGYGIFINGYGDHTIECNTINSEMSAIATSNANSNEDLQHVGYQNYIIRNNSLISSGGNTIESYRDPAGVPVTATFTGNKTSGRVYFDSNIPVTQSGNGPDVTPVCQSSNQSPVANAGADQTITLPASSVTLNGSGSDADGSITSYSWTKISGPSATIANASSAQTTLSNLVQGTYVYELKVTDNSGASSTDQVMITVNASSGSTTTTSSTMRIEAEKFSQMKGVSILSGGGISWVGDVEASDWMDYSVNIPAAATYTIKLHVATPLSGKQLQIKNASGTVLTTVSLPQSGAWDKWIDATATLSLPAGTQTLRIYAVTSYSDIDWFELTKN